LPEGHGRRAAELMTLIGTCKLQDVDPEAYLRDVLVRVATTPVSRIPVRLPRAEREVHRDDAVEPS
jgi:hypothetical protein